MNKDISRILLTNEDIRRRAEEMGKELSKVYEGKMPIILCLLKGSIPFTTYLMENMSIDVQLETMRASSYEGTSSTGKVKISEFDYSLIKGKDILIVEDIIDTGTTLKTVTEILKKQGANSVEICTLLEKVGMNKTDIHPKYVGFKIENEFVVGFGLDYNEKYRNLPYIGVLDPKAI